MFSQMTAFFDAGSFLNPLVVGVDYFRKVVVGYDVFGNVMPYTCYDRFFHIYFVSNFTNLKFLCELVVFVWFGRLKYDTVSALTDKAPASTGNDIGKTHNNHAQISKISACLPN